MARDNFVNYQNMQDILSGIEQKISGLGSQLTGIYTWSTNTQYKIGDVVIENGSLFVCTTVHTSSSSFSADVSNWLLFYADISPWLPNTYYVVNACVIDDKKLYQCKTAHTSGTTFSATNWNLIAGGGGSSISTWATSKQYNPDDIVIYANSIYKCNTTHTSSTFSSDASNWDLVYADLKNWASSVYYAVGTVVIYNSKIYTCNTAHTAASIFNATERANWTPLCVSTIKSWQASTTYDVDDLVMYNGSLYRCTTANTSSTFVASNFSLITSDLKLWSASINYVIGTTVINDGLLYRCTATHVSGSSFDATEKANWSVLGKHCIYAWQASHLYDVGDLISIGGSLFRCTTAHNSSSTFSTDIANWAIVHADIGSWTASTYYASGACVIYGDAIYQCSTAHTSGTVFADANWYKIVGKAYIQPYEDTPIGTIISFMGTTAPEDYLICDGTVYNISDYYELANFINTQFGSYNFFGGNGTSTFAVPDLRGEFLRGSGTNSRTNQGSGAAVGVHQNATEDLTVLLYNNNAFYKKEQDATTNVLVNTDSMIRSTSTTPISMMLSPTVYNDTTKQDLRYTSRPTNTSVLYCIKYTNAPSMQPSNIYSTTEKRIGTWIDGKALYQKTYDLTSPSATDTITELASLPTGVTVADITELKYALRGTTFCGSGYYYSNNDRVTIWIRANGKITGIVGAATQINKPLFVTICYTKT